MPPAEGAERAGTAPALTLEEGARRLGQLRWIELRLHEVLGGWVEVEPDAAAKVAFSEHGRRHAEHADVWAGRLPRTAHLDPDRLTGPAGSGPAGTGPAAVVDALAATRGPEQTVERLVGAYRVMVPRLVAAYDDLLARSRPVSDAPTMRWLRLVRADEMAGLAEGERLLARHLRAAPDVERAARHRGALEALLV